MADVTLYQRNNKFTVVSGATAGTSVMTNNKITVAIDAVDYIFNPLSRVPNASGYLFHKYGDIFTERITT